MELIHLIEQLSKPSAYSDSPDRVEVRQTHISVVFLAGPSVYKLKKPVKLGFLDFSTLKARQYYCSEEVRLNRRFAPEVYRGVVPITHDGNHLRFGGEGEEIECAVQMERLPDEANLLNRVLQNEIDPSQIEQIARRVADFHAQAESNPRISTYARFDVIAQNIYDSLALSNDDIDQVISRPVFERLRQRLDETLAEQRPRIEMRASMGFPRDTHGDLRLEHVYLFPDKQPPNDVIVVDCIEFNERYRYADPIADMAFLVMDLKFQGRDDLAKIFINSYFRAADDAEGLKLLPLYIAYRSMIRAKVGNIKRKEAEIPDTERTQLLSRIRAHWLFALQEIETANDKPCMVLVGGLPGTGKSTLARGLAEHASFHIIRSDEIRKELARRDSGNVDIYSAEWTIKTYKACLELAESLLFTGKRVLVDATFREEYWRQNFLTSALRWGVPGALLICQADPNDVRLRLEHRQGDISDADWPVYQQFAESWESSEDFTLRYTYKLNSRTCIEKSLVQGLEILQNLGLLANRDERQNLEQ